MNRPMAKTNNLACTPIADSGQYFSVGSSGSYGPTVASSGCHGTSESSLGAIAALLILSWASSNLNNMISMIHVTRIGENSE